MPRPVIYNRDSADAAARAVAAYCDGDASDFALQDMIADLGHWLTENPEQDHGQNDSLATACAKALAAFSREASDG